MKNKFIHPDFPNGVIMDWCLPKKIGFDLEGLEKSIHPDSPNGIIMDWCNGEVLAKKVGFDFKDLEKSIHPDSPDGIHNEEGLLPRFVLSEILPAILSSSEDNNSSEDEDLKRDCFAKEENSQPIFRRRVWSRLFCKDEKSFNVKMKK